MYFITPMMLAAYTSGSLLDTGLVPPTISVAVAQGTFPPSLNATFDISTLTTDNVRLQVSTDEYFSTIIINEVEVVGTGSHTFDGVSDISTGEHFFRERIERGSSYGAWSNSVKHGDVVAPTITSSASPSVAENTVNPTGTLTADETVTWEIIGGADASSFSVNATSGVWTLNTTPNYETKTSYVVQFRATDLAENTTNHTMTLSITDQDEIPTLTNGTFTDITGGTITNTYSFDYTVAGLGSGVTVTCSIDSGTFTKNGSGSYSSTTCVNGDVLAFDIVASGSYLTTVSKVLTVGAGSDTASVTTMADPSSVSWTAEAVPALQSLAFSTATATFSNINFGTGTGIIMTSSEGRRIGAVTVGGVSATLVVENTTTNSAPHASIWKVSIASAGLKNVVVTGNGTLSHIGIATGTSGNMNSAQTSTAIKTFAFGGNPKVTSTSITVPTGGLGLAVCAGGFSSSGSATWNNGTEETEAANASWSITSARYTVAGSITPSVNTSSTGTCMAAATWGL